MNSRLIEYLSTLKIVNIFLPNKNHSFEYYSYYVTLCSKVEIENFIYITDV